jgi:GTPase SAR1 family protein
VYDVTRKNSFISAQKWLMELKQYAEPDCIILLVGNKMDLIENNGKRDISSDEAQRFADENKLIFYETSALTDFKVNEAFDNLVNGKYLINILQKFLIIA